MYINGRWLTEPEIEAHIKKLIAEISALEGLLKLALKEIQRLGYEDCTSCAHSGSCIYADDCNYKWIHAEEVRRLTDAEP